MSRQDMSRDLKILGKAIDQNLSDSDVFLCSHVCGAEFFPAGYVRGYSDW